MGCCCPAPLLPVYYLHCSNINTSVCRLLSMLWQLSTCVTDPSCHLIVGVEHAYVHILLVCIMLSCPLLPVHHLHWQLQYQPLCLHHAIDLVAAVKRCHKLSPPPALSITVMEPLSARCSASCCSCQAVSRTQSNTCIVNRILTPLSAGCFASYYSCD